MKVTRGWKSYQTQIAEGQRIHYDFVKPHQALDGRTPAQVAGLQIAGWSALLTEAIKKKNSSCD